MAKLPTMDEFAKKVAESALDDFEYEGKTIREWAELILSGELERVIHCKDCEHLDKTGYEQENCSEDDPDLHMGWCVLIGRHTQACRFCSYGKRRIDL